MDFSFLSDLEHFKWYWEDQFLKRVIEFPEIYFRLGIFFGDCGGYKEGWAWLSLEV